jgi:hypothetical protein
MRTKKGSFTLANYEIANVNVTFLVLIYIYVRTILFVKIDNQFAGSNITPSLYLGILFQIYGRANFAKITPVKHHTPQDLGLDICNVGFRGQIGEN